ncbi:MAG: phage major capsid protein [Gammaproteobacteria bacterium]|nr:phage major capsid protein [Gammaproteobacteria bacterium]
MSNRTLIQKADLSLDLVRDNGGYLQDATAAKFIEELIEESVLMSRARVIPMKAPRMHIPRVSLSQRILRKDGVMVGLPNEEDRFRPQFTDAVLDAVDFRAIVRVPDQIIRDNVEGDKLANTLLSLGRKRVAADMEELAIRGDITSADPFLSSLDGFFAKANVNVVDFAGARISKNGLALMHRSLPQAYKRAKNAMEFYVSTNSESDYSLLVEERQTLLGDKALLESPRHRFQGSNIVPVPMFPEELGDDSDESKILLCEPTNMVFGIRTKIGVEMDRKAEEGYTSMVFTVSYDVQFEDVNAVVLGDNVLNQGFAA